MDDRIRKRKRKGPAVITRQIKGKMWAVFSLIVVALVFLCGILIYKNNEKGDEYSIQVLDQQNYSSTTIPYKRGDITDRNGNVLATSIKVYNMILDPKIMLSDDGKYLDDTVNALTECFGYDKEKILEFVNENAERSYYVYKKKLSYEEIKDFLEAKEDTKKYPNIQGVWFETEYERKYPYSTLGSSIIGFTSAGNVGTWGIEEYYNDYLNGIDGRQFGYVNNENIMQEVEKAAVDGDTVVSTIDLNIQTIIEKYINQYNEEYDPEHIGIVIMDPKNGEVLGMAGKLSYDLNNPRTLEGFYKKEEIDAMSDEEKYAALNEIWRNYCISDSYEPGSTAKPYTIAAALDENVIESDENFECNGYEVVGGWTIKCHNNQGHGKISLYQAIAYSCNDALMNIAAREGAETFTTYLNRFNFGLKTRIDLPGEESCSNLIRSAAEMGDADLATNSFGQNYNVTMIQVASAFSSLINGGYYYQPHVVKEIINQNGGVVKSVGKTLVKQTVTAETSNTIKEGLRLCVSGGTGGTACVDGYLISGKTGTAEKQPRGTGKYLLSFIGFAPYVNPQVVCYVIVDNPDVEGEQYTSYATKLWKAVMEEILPYMNIFPDDVQTEPDDDKKDDNGTSGGQDSQGTGDNQSGSTDDNQGTTGNNGNENQDEVFQGGIMDNGQDPNPGGNTTDPNTGGQGNTWTDPNAGGQGNTWTDPNANNN